MARTPKRQSGVASRKSGGKPSGPPARKLKPFSQLSPAYQKRFKTYAKKHGVTVSEARKRTQAVRGHKPAEHVIRRTREQERVAAFAERQSRRGEAYGSRSAAEIEEVLWMRIRQYGFKRYFVQLEKRIQGLHETAEERSYEPFLDLDDMDDEASVWELPTVELFYH